MKPTGFGILALGLATLVIVTAPAGAADDTKVKAATDQVESGAKKIREGEIGKGVEQTAKGVGHTAVEGARYTGEKFRESGEAASPPARSGWQKVKDGAYDMGASVRTYFTSLFNR
jgi:hypothetical protein